MKRRTFLKSIVAGVPALAVAPLAIAAVKAKPVIHVNGIMHKTVYDWAKECGVEGMKLQKFGHKFRRYKSLSRVAKPLTQGMSPVGTTLTFTDHVPVVIMCDDRAKAEALFRKRCLSKDEGMEYDQHVINGAFRKMMDSKALDGNIILAAKGRLIDNKTLKG